MTIRGLGLVLLVTLTVLSTRISGGIAQATDLLTIGSPAPELDIEHWLQDGKSKLPKISKFEKGKVYIVEFWATWCNPCVQSMPHLVETQKKYGKQGLQIISVSSETLDEVQTFLKRKVPGNSGLTFAELTNAYSLTTDPDQSTSVDYLEAAKKNSIPVAFIVGRDSKIEWIGSPYEMDEPLDAVMNDKWDRESFAQEYKEAQEAELLFAEIERKVKVLMRARKHKEALVVFDEAIAKIKSPDLQYQVYQNKLQYLLDTQGDAKELTATMDTMLKSFTKDPAFVVNTSWIVYQAYEDGKIDSRQLVKRAHQATADAIEVLDESNKGTAMDILAHLKTSLGDIPGALETGRQALKFLEPDQAKELNTFLKEIEKKQPKSK